MGMGLERFSVVIELHLFVNS